MVTSVPKPVWLAAVALVYTPLLTAPLYEWAIPGGWAAPPPMLHHAAAIVLHLACIWLAWGILERLLPSRPAMIAVLIFALHPAQVEPVTAPEGLAPLAASLTALAAWRLWLDGRLWWACAVGSLAGLVHPCAAGLAMVLAAYERGTGRRRESASPLGVMFALPAISLAFSAQFAFDYFAYQGVALLRALWVFMVPIGLAPVPDVRTGPLAASMAWGVIAVIALLSLRGAKRVQEGFWLLSALLFVLPEASFIAGQDLASGRRFYLPMLACAALAGLMLRNSHRVALALTGVLMLAITVSQVSLWRDETALWMESARLSPNELRPRLEVARRLAPAQSVELLEDTARLWPGRARIHADLALAYNRAGRRGEAVRTVEYALKQAPCEAQVRDAAKILGIEPPACEATGPAR